MIGQTVSYYKIIEKLGEGGMSQSCPRVPLEAGRGVATLRIPLESRQRRDGSGRYQL